MGDDGDSAGAARVEEECSEDSVRQLSSNPVWRVKVYRQTGCVDMGTTEKHEVPKLANFGTLGFPE